MHADIAENHTTQVKAGKAFKGAAYKKATCKSLQSSTNKIMVTMQISANGIASVDVGGRGGRCSQVSAWRQRGSMQPGLSHATPSDPTNLHLTNLASHLILGWLPQELDVINFAISIEGVHEDAEAPAGCGFLVIQLGEDTILRLSL